MGKGNRKIRSHINEETSTSLKNEQKIVSILELQDEDIEALSDREHEKKIIIKL